VKEKKVVIIDYGMGNLFSIERAMRFIGGSCLITDDAGAISKADRVILPGVGAFGAAMESIRAKGIDEAIGKFLRLERPLLGICLGMQLLMSESSEFGRHKGLDIIKGKVIRFSDPTCHEERFKIPHIGWNRLELPGAVKEGKRTGLWDGTILSGLGDGVFTYFVHSYFVKPDDAKNILSETIYGNDRFCSSIFKGNIYGCQFHPERSGEAGLHMYRHFLSDI